MINITKQKLDKIYDKYNRREYIHPDPLEFLYHFNNPFDQEIIGLISSSLAYGRVKQILKSVAQVLNTTKSPYNYLKKTTNQHIIKDFKNFKHRFTTGKELADLLINSKNLINKYNSLENLFKQCLKENHDFLKALSGFTNRLTKGGNTSLISSPDKGSSCKRLNLFLRWMIRKDNVDPGTWKLIDTSKLIIPLDTHMYKIGTSFGFTKRKQANLKTAIEITNSFAKFSPKDPVKYDFCLTRYGIREELSITEIFSI